MNKTISGKQKKPPRRLVTHFMQSGTDQEVGCFCNGREPIDRLMHWQDEEKPQQKERPRQREQRREIKACWECAHFSALSLSFSLCGSPSMREKTFHTTLRFNCVSVSFLTTFAFARFSTVIKTKSYVITTQRPHTRTHMHSPVLHKHTHEGYAHTHIHSWGQHTMKFTLSLFVEKIQKEIQLFVFFTSLYFFVLLLLIWFCLKLRFECCHWHFSVVVVVAETDTHTHSCSAFWLIWVIFITQTDWFSLPSAGKK